MSKTTRSISLPARTVLGGGMKGEQGTRGVSSNVKGSQRGREKEKEIEVRWSFYVSKNYLKMYLLSFQAQCIKSAKEDRLKIH